MCETKKNSPLLIQFSVFQFNRYEPDDGRITERDFAHILLLYAGLNETKRIKMLKRVKKEFKDAKKVCGDDIPILCNYIVIQSKRTLKVFFRA